MQKNAVISIFQHDLNQKDWTNAGSRDLLTRIRCVLYESVIVYVYNTKKNLGILYINTLCIAFRCRMYSMVNKTRLPDRM